jgi:hypothetical protein
LTQMGEAGSAHVSDAVTIAVALGAALSSVWGYYITVLVGLAAAIGALAASGKAISVHTKSVISFAIILFRIVNVYSLNATMNSLNAMIDYISTHSDDLDFGIIVGRMRFTYWMLDVQPVGVVPLLIWLWLY